MQKYILANWKMQLSIRESVALARAVMQMTQGRDIVPALVVFPSATALGEVHKTLARSRVALGAQACGPARAGAYTGEIGLAQLEDVGCVWAMIGHAERRAAGETAAAVAARVRAVLTDSALHPVIFVGADLVEGDATAPERLRQEITQLFADTMIPHGRTIALVVEPAAAIGTGAALSPARAVVLHAAARAAAIAAGVAASDVRVFAGGSIDRVHAYALLREQEIDGVVLGKSSLQSSEFRGVVEAACEVLDAQNL